MKKIALIISILLIIALLCLVGFSAAGLYFYYPAYSESYKEAYDLKIDNLEAAETEADPSAVGSGADGSKVDDGSGAGGGSGAEGTESGGDSGAKAIFVGGSASLYAIKTEKFEKKTGIRSYNMALTRKLPFTYYTEKVKPFLNEGDILFIAPEYEYFSQEVNFIDELSVYWVVQNAFSWPTDLSEMGRAVAGAFDQGWENSTEIMATDDTEPHVTQVFEHRIDEYGDFTDWHLKKYALPITSRDIDFHDKGFIDWLSAEVSEFREMGVTVYIIAPPFQAESYDRSVDAIKKIESEMNAHGLEYFIAPEESVYSDAYFFDTSYHLTVGGAYVFTGFVATKFLGNS